MLHRRSFRGADDAIGPLFWIGIFMLIALALFAIAAYYFVQMLLQNIIPIAIAIALVIAVSWIAKAYFSKKTGMPPYAAGAEGERSE